MTTRYMSESKAFERERPNTSRRHFITTAVAGAVLGPTMSALSQAANVSDAPSRDGARQMDVDVSAKIVAEPARKTPVVAEVDVVVAGGGPTGVGAALAAASEGAKTLLVERHAMLGGVWTAGLLNPLFDPRKGWTVDRLIDNLQQRGAWVRKGMDVFDVEAMKYVLERMMAEAKVEF
jgi:NADPH-dependent 2,4-dienoyl-CoA reductase/sulfur reductase-like enzyme